MKRKIKVLVLLLAFFAQSEAQSLCYVCNGDNCLQPSEATSTANCTSACYIGLNSDSKTVRGCASDFSNTNLCSTSADSTTSCFTCNGDLCNSIIYPKTGRLQCHTCLNNNCEISQDSASYCNVYSSTETCVTVFSQTDDTVVSRGCSSEINYQQVCDNNAGNCKQCSYDKCNIDDSKLKIYQCIGCNSIDDPNCNTGNSIRTKNCLTTECYSRTYYADANDRSGLIVDKGCLADLVATSVPCTGDSCSSCNGTNCNNLKYPASRISCKTCVGEACLSSNLDEKVCTFYSPNEACITFYNDDSESVYRDCYADAPTSTKEICDDSNNLECSKCSTSNCNVDTARRGNKCFKCSGIECFNPSLANLIDCQSSCYVGINENESVRDCVSSTLSCSANDPNCLTCDEDFCNGISFPIEERRSCMYCSGADCPLSQETKLCEVYGYDENCETRYDSSMKVVEKGCSSSMSYQNAVGVKSCSFDNCNVDLSFNDNGLCVSCNSPNDLNCITNPLQSDLASCFTDQCYSRVLENGVVERGCGAALTTTCSGENCAMCTGSRCNTNSIPSNRQSCYKCSGMECLNGFGKSELCLGSTDSDCITIFGEESQVIYRNCYSDVNAVVQSLCNDPNSLECSKCTGSNCNIDVKRKGVKCFKCSGSDCFNPSLSSVQDCQSSCYVGLNQNGQTVRDCVSSTLSCSANATNCLICSDDFCNGITFPTENRRSCLQCSGNDCATSEESQYCEVFSSSELCVTVFDSTNTVIQRGCSSSITTNFTSKLSCNFDNCNTQKSISEAFYCIACSSASDKNCILNPKGAGSMACTTNECYSRALDTDIVDRGCAATLSSTCSGDNCIKCNGTQCNVAQVPLNRQSCYKCSGSNCAMNFGTAETCLSHKSNGCVTIFGEDASVIYRNCYSDVNNIVQSLCDDSNSINCIKCNSTNCNTQISRAGTRCFKCSGMDCFSPTLSDVVDCKSSCYVGVNQNGQTVRDCTSSTLTCADTATNCLGCSEDFCNGITFPTTNRRSCMFCSGTQCTTSESSSKYCEIFSSSEKCATVFDSNSNIIEKGCSSSLSVNSTNKLTCNFDNCNTHKAITETFYCIACNSEGDSKCITNPQNTNTATCTTNECYSRVLTNGIVERGCGNALASACSGDNCIKCNGMQCNSIDVPRNRHSCYKCSGLSCSNSTAVAETCLSHSSNSCITIFDEDSKPIYRNCYSDVNVVVQSLCDDLNNLECTKCTGSKNCNTQTARRGKICLRCSGAECLTANAGSDTITCQTGGCYVGINSIGETVRGCASSFQNSSINCAANDTESKTCLVCQDDFCNSISYPIKDRAQCHVCSGSQCAATEDNLNYCARYNEKCVTVFDNNGVIERGCLSSLTNARKCVQDAGKCIGCMGSGCNTASSLTSQTCVNCNSQTDPNCVQNPSLATTKMCSTRGCYTRLVNGYLNRGCVEDIQNVTCNSANNCQSCSASDKCNSEKYPENRLECLTCEGAIACQKATAKSCTIYSAGDKCVTIFDNYKLSIKGCLADQTTTIQNQCSTNSTTCSLCSANNCNTDTVRKDEACIICNSDVDSNCAQKPNNLTSKKCFNVSDGQCFTRIMSGSTIRGCKGALTSTQISSCNGADCTLTTGQGSNIQIFPSNRLKCHHCNSLISSNCSETQTMLDETLPCKKISLTEQCIKITSSSGAVMRGCEADFSANICDAARCEKCTTEGCNKSFAVKMTFSLICMVFAFIVILLK